MKREVVLLVVVGIICLLVGILTGKSLNSENVVATVEETSMAATLSADSIRINDGNIEWFDGAAWQVLGSVDDIVLSDDVTNLELEEYFYPIIIDRLEKESIEAASSEAASIEAASIEAASIAAEEASKAATARPANTWTPAPTAAQTEADNYEEEENNDSPAPAPEPEPEPEPETEAEPEDSGDGEDMDWSDDVL